MQRRNLVDRSTHPRRWFGAAVLALAMAASGCAIVATPYHPSVDNVERLREARIAPVQVGGFAPAQGAVGATTISLRGTSMSSPIGAGYADYLAMALRRDLELARLFDPTSRIEVSGILVRNDIAAGGIVTNSGEIEATFVVRRDGQVRFEKTKRVSMTWESGFAAATALPLAQRQYPILVQKLLGEVFADTEFIEACR